MRRSGSASSLASGSFGSSSSLVSLGTPRPPSVAVAAFPMSASPMTSSWDLAEVEVASAFVPARQALSCGVVHTFPVSVLGSREDNDAASVAVCLASPTLPPSDPTEDAEVDWDQEAGQEVDGGGRTRRKAGLTLSAR